MSRVYNFSAGPAVLPEPVLKEVADEMMDYQGTGMSVMEMSHRSPEFQKIICLLYTSAETYETDLSQYNVGDNILQTTFEINTDEECEYEIVESGTFHNGHAVVMMKERCV